MHIVENSTLHDFIRLHIQDRDRASFGETEIAAHIAGLKRILEVVGIPEPFTLDDWLHYVASPRINNEVLTPWMSDFQTWLWEDVQNMDMESKILRVNELAAREVTYRSSNARTLPPPALKRAIYGRCGEESTFVTAALRSVGIPARQVYAPLWNHSDDNHAWVEAFDGKNWRFLGACEPEAVLDVGWFNLAASRAPLVVSRTHVAGLRKSRFDLGVNAAGQCLRNESLRYREGAWVRFSIPTEDEGVFTIHLLNYSTPAPLLQVAMDSLNEYEINLGAGTYLVSYMTTHERYAANLDLMSLTDQTLVLHAESWEMSLRNLPRYWHASGVSRRPSAISEEARERGLAIRTDAAAMRQAKEDAQIAFAETLASGRSEIEREILLRSGGNSTEVEKLLDLTGGDESVQQLLLYIPQKDLYELKAEEYIREIRTVMHCADDLDPKVRAETLLNPRIHAEVFSLFRSELRIKTRTPDEILDWMIEQYPLTQKDMEPYEPLTVLAKQTELSLRDFTKLLCGYLRAHGYPAIYRSTGLVEVYDKEWKMLTVVEYSGLRLNSQNREYVWRVGQNYQLINFDVEPLPVHTGHGTWSGASEVIHVIGRQFAVITTVRLPNGDQRSEIFFVNAVPGEVTDIEIDLPHVTSNELLIDAPLPSEAIVQALNLSDAETGFAILARGGHEPTEHAFEELALLWDGLRSRIDHFTVYYDDMREGAREALDRSPRFNALLDKGLNADLKPLNYAAHLESLGRGLFVEPEMLPLILLYESRENTIRVRFAFAGYAVGLGETILNSLEEILR